MSRFLDRSVVSVDGFRIPTGGELSEFVHSCTVWMRSPQSYFYTPVWSRNDRVLPGNSIVFYEESNKRFSDGEKPLCTFLTFILKIHANRECKALTSPLRFFVLSDAVFHEFRTDNRYAFTRFSKRFDESDRTRPSSRGKKIHRCSAIFFFLVRATVFRRRSAGAGGACRRTRGRPDTRWKELFPGPVMPWDFMQVREMSSAPLRRRPLERDVLVPCPPCTPTTEQPFCHGRRRHLKHAFLFSRHRTPLPSDCFRFAAVRADTRETIEPIIANRTAEAVDDEPERDDFVAFRRRPKLPTIGRFLTRPNWSSKNISYAVTFVRHSVKTIILNLQPRFPKWTDRTPLVGCHRPGTPKRGPREWKN